jgi:4-hydroxy-2-oxoheptanedioate aldolase
MSTEDLDGIYIGPADLSLAVGAEPSFDIPETSPVFKVILTILEHAKKNNIIPAIHNMSPAYAQKMINLGFKLVTIGADQRYMSAGAKSAVEEIKKSSTKEDSKTY